MAKNKNKPDKFEARRLRIMKVLMTRYLKDGFQDIGGLILAVEKLVQSECAEEISDGK